MRNREMSGKMKLGGYFYSVFSPETVKIQKMNAIKRSQRLYSLKPIADPVMEDILERRHKENIAEKGTAVVGIIGIFL